MLYREGKHSSVGLKIRPIAWEDWLRRYGDAEYVDDRISLLYQGLTGTNNPAHAITFYLKEAEGHTDIMSSFFGHSEVSLGESRVETLFGDFSRVEEVYREVAKLAFGQLVTHFFKDTRETGMGFPSWFPYAMRPSVTDALLTFFRIDEDHSFVNFLDSLVDPNKVAIVTKFLDTWARYPWQHIPRNSRSSSDLDTRCYAKRIEFMDILCGLGKLDCLLHDTRPNAPVGQPEFKKLCKLALSCKVYLPQSASRLALRFPSTIEEAAFGGSQAGRIAILLREKLGMEKHFSEVSAAEQAYVEAQERLKQVKG